MCLWTDRPRTFATLVIVVLVLNHGVTMGEPGEEPNPGFDTREAIFQAFTDAVRRLDPEGILDLCDSDTIELGSVWISGTDPRTIPEYAAIPGLVQEIEKSNAYNREILEKIPETLTDPYDRLVEAIRLRMLKAGEEYCRSFDGRLGDPKPFFSIPGIEGYEQYTEEEHHACEGVIKAFPLVRKDGKLRIGFFGFKVLTAYTNQTLDKIR